MTASALLCVWLGVCVVDENNLPIAEGMHCAAGAYELRTGLAAAKAEK